MIYKILLFTGIFLNVIGQLVMKKGMRKRGKVSLSLRKVHKDVFNIYFDRHVIFGVSCYLVSFFIWLVVLSNIDLSYAYPLVSVNFVLVALFSKLFFKERISKRRWLSIAVILIGVILVTSS